MEGCFILKILFTTGNNLFFRRTTVLLGGSSVKKLTELYDLTKELCFGLCWYRLSIKVFLAYANLVICQKYYMIYIKLRIAYQKKIHYQKYNMKINP